MEGDVMLKRNLKVIVAVLMTLVLTSVFKPLAFIEAAYQPTQEGCRIFKETQRVICGRFLEYWQQHGGLAIFGYPVSNEFLERSGAGNLERMVQYFERAVFERHVENKPPNDVLLSRLGSLQFENRYTYGNPMGSYPLYPNAQQLSAERDVSEVTFKFTTRDSPAAVTMFYKSALPPLGWKLDTDQGDKLWFYYAPTDPRAKNTTYLPGINYSLLVQVTSTRGGPTSVEVGVAPEYIP